MTEHSSMRISRDVEGGFVFVCPDTNVLTKNPRATVSDAGGMLAVELVLQFDEMQGRILAMSGALGDVNVGEPDPFSTKRFTVQLTLKTEHAAKLRDHIVGADDPVEALFDNDDPDWPIWNVSNYDVAAVDIS